MDDSAAGLQPIGAAALGHPLHWGHVGCAALHSLQQVLLQFVAHCSCTVTMFAALRCNGIIGACTALHSLRPVAA